MNEYNQYNKTNKVEKDIKIISTVNLNIVIEFNTSCLTYTLHDNIHNKNHFGVGILNLISILSKEGKTYIQRNPTVYLNIVIELNHNLILIKDII